MATILDSWTNGWTEAMWRACWQGGLFIAAVWLVCRLVRRLPIFLRCWLWWLACVKLLILFVWAGGVPIRVLAPSSPPQLAAAVGMKSPAARPHAAAPLNEPGADSSLTPSTKPAQPPSVAAQTGNSAALQSGHESALQMPSASSMLVLVWLCGVIGCLIVAAKQLVGLRSLLQNAESLDHLELAEEVRRLGIELGLTSPPRVLATSKLTSPMVHGVAQPILILPRAAVESLSPEELRMLAAHELAHVRRRDLWLLSVPLLARAFFWFFPPAWVACRGWQAAQEAACDAEAVKVTNTRPSVYAELLIRVAAQDTRGGLLYALGATASYHTLRERLTILKNASASAGSILRPISNAAGLAAFVLVVPLTLSARNRTEREIPVRVAKPTAIEYTLTDLGTLGGDESAATSINSNGDVVGWANDADGLRLPFIWQNGKIKQLRMPPDFQEGEAHAINDASVIAVTYKRAEAGPDRWQGHSGQAFLCSPEGEPLPINSLSGDFFSTARALNNSGTVVGNAGDQDYSAKACLWCKGDKQALHVPHSQQATALAVNDAGVIVGEVNTDGPEAVVWTNRDCRKLGTFGGRWSKAQGINNRDQIVGWARRTDGDDHGFLYQDDEMHDLGTLGGKSSNAAGVNDSGQIVGTSTPAGDDTHACLWNQGRGVIDLNTVTNLPVGWTLYSAGAINKSGQIVGVAKVDSMQRAFLLTPIHMRRVAKGCPVLPASEWMKPPQPYSGTPLPRLLRELESKRVRSSQSGDIYLVIDGKRHLIPLKDEYTGLPDGRVYKALFGYGEANNWLGDHNIITVPDLDRIPLGEPLSADAHIARAPGLDKTFLVTNGRRRWIVNDETWKRFGFATKPREEPLEAMGPEGPLIR